MHEARRDGKAVHILCHHVNELALLLIHHIVVTDDLLARYFLSKCEFLPHAIRN